MDEPYQLILDFWEGNPDIDVKIVKENDVRGMICRINDMNGGHHMDARFAQNWELAKLFPLQAVYFVYNPWVSGKENYNWLKAHLPSDYGRRRIFVDIEVSKPNYSSKIYGEEVAKFLLYLALDGYETAIYTGYWFLNRLDSWPKDQDYWWASYPDILTYSRSWKEYKENIKKLNFSAFTKLSPGKVRLWQSTGDGVRLEGFGNHAVDVNIMPGTLEEAAKWFGCKLVKDPVEEGTMASPIGLFTRVSGWSKNNPNFNFVAGAAQVKDTVEPNPQIKPIELEAASLKIPFLLWWEHLPWPYSEQQWGENNWPDEQHDYIFQNFKAILAARSYSAVVVSVNTFKTPSGSPEDKAFVAYSARRFMDRVSNWLRTNNRSLVPLILATSDAFMTNYAPNMKNWAHNFDNMAVQKAVVVKDSYPLAGEKPNYLGASTECPWWRYYEFEDGRGLMLFRGQNGYPSTVEGMAQWLNYNVVIPPPDDGGGDPDPVPLPNDVEAQIKALDARIKVIEAALKKPILS